MTAAAPQPIPRWASQAVRAPAAFAPENARLDPRALPELLADIARIAADIPFHDDSGAVDGNWRRVLLADQSFVLALLATAGIDSRAEALDALIDRARRGAGAGAGAEEARLTELVEALLGFAGDLDAWLAPADLGGATRGQSIRRLAEGVIERVLGPQLQRLVDRVAAIEEAELTERFRDDPVFWELGIRPWRRARLEGEVRGVSEAVERVWAERMLSELADAVEVFVEEMRALGRRAANAFSASLASGDHSAHPALVIAFAQLFGHAQDLLNAVPAQLIDFYQQRLLAAAPAPARPDRILLAMVPRPGTRPRLAKGTLVSAGKGIAFALDTALDVTGAALRDAWLWRPSAGGTLLAQLPVGPDGVLGEPVTSEPFEARAIFSSPLLDLAGGTRRITLVLTLDGAVDANRLRVSISTAEATWLPVAADISADGETLEIGCVLPPDFPPATALCLTRVGPTIDARIADARLTIAIKDAPGLRISTSTGPASTSAAAPFGTPPGPGGWLRIDHPLLEGPPLDRLVLGLDWAGLPPGETGFAGYYRGYVVDAQGQLFDWPPLDNAAFTVTLAAPMAGGDVSHRLPLFAPASLGSAPPIAAAPPPDIFAADFEPAPPLMPEEGPLAPSSWFAAASRAGDDGATPDHICLTLAGPSYGFGHALHAANVQYATEAIARGDAPPARPGLLRRLIRAILGFPARLLRKIEGVEEAEPEISEPVAILLPNPPFQPLLSGIRLDVARTIGGDALTLHHAATRAATIEQPMRGAALFPAGPAALSLDLCFDGAQPGDVLALLVRLAAARADAAPEYHYRSDAGWQPLPSNALLADDTRGFTLTGILRLSVPADAAMPFALRLRFADALAPPAIVAITADAVGATRRIDGGETMLAPIPAETVTRLAGVARVVQPLDSAGGQPPEPAPRLRARTAERVRHRARALTAWDIERLILSEFPGIARVRVRSEGDPARQHTAAQIRAVVIPAPEAAGAFPPRAAPQLCTAIGERIATLASPFARISVIDPDYVRIDIAASLVLDAGDAAPIEAALAALLSPWAERALDLPDDGDPDLLRAAIAGFLLDQPGVRAIDRLTVSFDGTPGWQVPIAGDIAVTGIAAQAVASW